MTAMVCVLDGPRSAGKTTIVNAVLDCFADSHYKVSVHKTDRPSSSLWNGINETLDTWLSLPDDETIIVDRFHLTEYVYSTALGRVDDFDLARNTWSFDKRLAAYRGWFRYTVLMASNTERGYRTSFVGKDEDMPSGLVWPIWSLAVAQSSVATIRINQDMAQSQQCVEDIVNWIKNPSRYGVK